MTTGETTRRFGQMVGGTPRMQMVFSSIARAASVKVPVLITGETGTGKELVAREIHERSPLRNQPFVAVNTGALTPDLVASELFGHRKGAFTGAVGDKAGRFAEADGGTLFLDEITSMDERVQVALLRVLEARSFRPVGAREDVTVDVRLVAATNVDLHDAVDQNIFRVDLLHRLEVFQIALPPLREHIEDVPELAYYFLEKMNEEYELVVDSISPETMEALQAYSWPGNIRELRNVIAQASILAESGVITPDHLPQRVLSPSGARREEARPELAPVISSVEVSTDGPMEMDSDALQGQEGVFFPLGVSWEEAQKAYALKTLAYCGNNKTLAAKMLKVSRKTLYDKLHRWGVLPEQSRES